MSKNDSNSGCGCIILLLFCIGGGISQCNRSCNDSHEGIATDSLTVDTTIIDDSRESYVSYYETLSEEDREYLENSLTTGTQPYSDFYGESYVCHRAQCSAIEVTAPINSDIVVIIKRNNDSGKVVSHAYMLETSTPLTYPMEFFNHSFIMEKDGTRIRIWVMV